MRRKLRLVLPLSIILLVFAFLAIFSKTNASTSNHPNANDYEILVNESRLANNLVPLETSQNLRSSACDKAQDMVDRNYWSHTDPDGNLSWYLFTRHHYSYRKAGENLAMGFITPKATVRAWLESPSHRKNLMGDYTDQGICVRKGLFQGNDQNVIVQHLGKR